jgi:putative DNA methylase
VDYLEKRFIESVNFPFQEISKASAIEKGPGRPPHWEMVFWWTRKPLISARAIIIGCLLPENTNPTNFLNSIGIKYEKRPNGKLVFKETPHRVKPTIWFNNIKLLDPFACFGSIPLEGLRLGLSVTACDLLPVGYVFLKAVLEYPTKYGQKLIKDVKKWGEWIIEKLKEDQMIKELYDKDIAVYIGSWEIKCPNCGKWTPLIGNWWLARVKSNKGYERLAWMEPEIKNDKIVINIIDLNKIFGDAAVKDAEVEGFNVKIGGKEFRIPESNIEARREKGICLHCNQSIMQIDPETGKHYIETKGLPKEIKDRLEGYVKFALKLYNKWIEKSGSLPEWISEVPARQRLLVKVKIKQGSLEFEPCIEEDQQKLEKAEKEIKKLLEQNDPDIPKEPIPLYEARSIWVVNYGMDKWYKLFNPRQLLTLVKIVKLIREAGKKIEQEKLKEGLSQEEVFKYVEAITTYLAIALCKYIDYNSIVNYWNASLIRAPTMAVRGIAMQWNFCDTSSFIQITGSFVQTINNSRDGLSYLVSVVHNVSPNLLGEDHAIAKVKVSLDDATVLSKLDSEEKFDLIVTDPPYYDDVPYAELSDFYYVWLKRALSDVKDGHLVPRFLSEAFFEKVSDEWVEVSTQWEKYALSEVSLNPPRLGIDAKYENGIKHFQNLLNSSFITIASKLNEKGLLVTYYAHTDPDAWKALLKAGWEAANLWITNAFPITTESAQSVVSRGKLSMDTSIVVIWRGFSQGSIDASELYNEMVEEAANRAKELMDLSAIGRDLLIGTLAAALAVATKYREVRVMGKIDIETLIDKYIYPATYLGLAKALAKKAELKESVKSPDAMFYLLVKSLLAGAKKKTLESTDARIFSIGTSLDLNVALKTLKILRRSEKEAGAKVAKAKTLILVEPPSMERSKIAEFLEIREIGIRDMKIRCSIDVLHVLEYFAVIYSREEFKRKLDELRANYPAFIEDALSMARIMAKILPEEDVEKTLCNRIVEYLEISKPKLEDFLHKG